jgi:hypothetical protein
MVSLQLMYPVPQPNKGKNPTPPRDVHLPRQMQGDG